MKWLDVLFLPYFAIWFFIGKEIKIIFYTNLAFLTIQILLSFKYKLDETRWTMIAPLIVITLLGFCIGINHNGGGIDGFLLIWMILSPFVYFFVFTIYIGMFIINPIYLKIKRG